MGRPRGSKNRPKSDRQSIGNPIPSQEEPPNEQVQPDTSPPSDALETPPEVAPGDAPEGSEAVAAAVIDTVAEVIEIAPPVMPTSGRPLDEIAHEMANTDREKRALEGEKSEVMKDYNKRIGLLDAKCAELASEYLSAERPETYDYKAGFKFVWDGRTGKLVDKVALGPMVQLPLTERAPEAPQEQQPTRSTFSDLVDGKVWEHEEHGYCRILAVLEDSVRVQTEDLDEDDAGIEISRADWDAHEAHPREVPELEIGQVWVIDGRECIITGLDDFAALVTWTEDDEPARIARLSFCGASKPSSDDDTSAIPELAEGQHWRLAAGDLVTITAVEELHASVRWAKTGLGGSVPIDDFAGAQAATQEEIDAALVRHEEPKPSRKRAAGEG